MSITITPLSAERLAVTGDVETTLRVPFDADEDRFHLAFSDGTLIAGDYDPERGRFHYLVEVEGAGFARVGEGVLTLEWRVEWLTIATYRPGMLPVRVTEPLPLFERT